MTCNDCVHNEICQKFGGPFNINDADTSCTDFKDRSQFVELPCHTGEKVWVTYFGRKEAIRSKEKGEVIGFFITSSLRVCASVILEDSSTFTGIYGKNVLPRKEELGKECEA